MADSEHPIEGQMVLLAGARASVPLQRLSPLLETVQTYLDEHRETYGREYERVAGPDPAVYLAPADHWETVAEAVELEEREADAVRRAHEAQFRREGRRTDRDEEFERSLEIRAPVVVG